MEKNERRLQVGAIEKIVLQRVIDTLPPKNVVEDNNAILSRLESYSKAQNKIKSVFTLLNETKPYFQNIKKKLGAKNVFYLNLSTLVVIQALHGIIEHLNAFKISINESLNQMSVAEKMSLVYNLEQQEVFFDPYKKIIRDAWDAFQLMDKFDLTSDVKLYYQKERKSIKTLCKSYGIETPWEPPTIKELGEGFVSHIKSDESTAWQSALIVQILSIGVSYWAFYRFGGVTDELRIWLYWGIGIGAISWMIALYEYGKIQFSNPQI